MADLPVYEFPSRPPSGLLLGLSAARLASLAAAAVVVIASMTSPTPARLATGTAVIVMLVAAATVTVAGRAVVDWLPVWVGFGWGQATRNNEFYTSPDLQPGLPDGMLDLPGGLFGIELHQHTRPADTGLSSTNPTPAGYGILTDTFRHRVVAMCEIAGEDFLFLDPPDQQARIAGWGGVLDHLATTLPELTRLQLVHTAGPATPTALAEHHGWHGGRGTDATAVSYRQLLDDSAALAQQHRLLLAIGLDVRAARRAIRRAGGGRDGTAAVLLDRAATVEHTLRSAGLEPAGWLPARSIAGLLADAYNPAGTHNGRPVDVNAGGGVDPAAAGPAGMAESWSLLRHDSGWSTTLHIVRPPARPVAGDFLQHLLIGVPARRRLSILYVPMPAQAAERRAQSAQVSAESEQTVRARLGFTGSARHDRSWRDAARREQDLVDGRTVWRIVWQITITAHTPDLLDQAVGQVETAARRCQLETRRLAGTQHQAFGHTLPLCRGAR